MADRAAEAALTRNRFLTAAGEGELEGEAGEAAFGEEQ
jgi:hypothetical protein